MADVGTAADERRDEMPVAIVGEPSGLGLVTLRVRAPSGDPLALRFGYE